MRMRSILKRGVGMLVLLSLPACGPKQTAAPVSVKGKVQYASGKSVAKLVLIFHPLDDTRQGKIPSFVLDAEGRFADQVLPGRYKATLAPLPRGSGPAGGAEAAPVQVPAASLRPNPLGRYQDRQQSPWEIEIPSTGKEDLLLTVE
jgi:hypothetical protein